MSKWYDIQVRGRLGGDKDDQHEITILNRPVRWVGDTVELEVDPKHVRVLYDAFDLCGKSAGSEWPVVKETKEDVQREEEEPLGPEETTRYRALAATGNFLSQDRTDIQFAAKEICRDMSTPRPRSWKKVKRLVRYLLEYPRLV